MAGKGHGFVTHQLEFLLGCPFLPAVNPVAAGSALVSAGAGYALGNTTIEVSKPPAAVTTSLRAA